MTGTVEETPQGFAISRDGKGLKTPAGAPLIVPTRALAEAIGAEKPVPKKTTPLLQLAFTAIDIITPAREKVADQVLAYAGSELLCHRAEHPSALVREQVELWQPMLDWCAGRFKAPLNTGNGVMPIRQSPESLQALREVVTAYDAFRLTGLSQAVAASGSLVLGLALADKQLSAADVSRLAALDAMYQMKEWGEDPDIKARIDAVADELTLYERWFNLLETIK